MSREPQDRSTPRSSWSTSPAWSPASATGEGLGNRFLAGIREADALCLVLRAFEDPGVAGRRRPGGAPWCAGAGAGAGRRGHGRGPDRQAAEGGRADRPTPRRRPRSTPSRPPSTSLHAGTPVYRSPLDAEQRAALGPVFLLTNKPVLVVVNLGEDQLARRRHGREAGGRRARGNADGARRERPAGGRGGPLDPGRAGRAAGGARLWVRARCPGWPGPPTTCSAGGRSSPRATRSRGRGRSGPGPGRPSAPG